MDLYNSATTLALPRLTNSVDLDQELFISFSIFSLSMILSHLFLGYIDPKNLMARILLAF